MHSPSLRARAAVAAASAAAVVVLLAAGVVLLLLARDAGLTVGMGTAVTLRVGDNVSSSEGPVLPAVQGPVLVDGLLFQVRTTSGATAGSQVTIGVVEPVAQGQTRRRRRLVLGVAAGGILLAAAIAWVLTGRAVRPLRLLAERTRLLPITSSVGADLPEAPVLRAAGSRESEELAEALTGLLRRVRTEQEGRQQALEAARDFAAAARHELRTPLTAMRTDLEVLHTYPDLPERPEVIEGLIRTQQRVEATLTALGDLAAGDLVDPASREDIDVAGLLARVAEDAARTHGVTIEIGPVSEVTVPGWPEGLHLALNAVVTNAVRHGHARRVVLGVVVAAEEVVLTVDDDGCGLPVAERDAVRGRFVRGSTASGSGSGLGLALVEQQTRRHGGRLGLTDAPTGGLRVELHIARVLPAPDPNDGTMR